MTPLEFLAAVLPPPNNGHYCVAALDPVKKTHRFVQTIAETKPYIREWLGAGRNVFFALATYEDPAEGRKAINARYIKALFLDLDKYDSVKEAGLALFAFLAKTGLDVFGMPHIIASGGGIHVYWPLTQVADIDQWRPVAEALKRLCKQEGLIIDYTVTADAARVLRVPSTINFKKKYPTPRPVKMLQEGNAQVDLRRFAATVRGLLRDDLKMPSDSFSQAGLALPGRPPTKTRTALAEALMGNNTTRFETIWLKSEKGTGCGQIDYYRNNAADEGMEPLWRGLLSLAKVCEDADEYALKLTEMHPYTVERMHEKLNSIKGPYSCVKIDSENPGICTGCTHWGKITNPLALGREVVVDNARREITIPTKIMAPTEPVDADDDDDASLLVTRKFTRPLPPHGFDYGARGGIYRSVELTDASGEKSKVQVVVLPYDLYVVDLLRMDTQEVYANLMAIKPCGPEDEDGNREKEYIQILLPQKTVVAQDELLKVLASQGVAAANGKFNDQFLYAYVRGAVEQAGMQQKPVDVPTQYGWQKDRSFVYNSRIFKPDGTVVTVPMPGLENLNRATTGRGTVEEWREFWELMIRRKMYTMLALCLDSFGSTLMQFSEYEGFVWHIGSTESGTGKSLTLNAKAAVWGHPVRYRTGKGTSHVAMQQRAGLLNSMPLLIDEVTDKARNDASWVPEFIFNISEGQGKERMESGANKERVNNSTWALTCTMTSNTHMHDVLMGARKHASNGEVMRMLEWTPTKQINWAPEDRDALQSMRRNYGVAGETWVRYVVRNHREVQRVWDRAYLIVKERIGFVDEERYWHAACTSVVTAAILCGAKHANLIETPIEAVMDALGVLVKNAREAQKKNVRTAEDILSSYIGDNNGRFVTVRKDAMGGVKTEMGLDLSTKTSTRTSVMGRVEIDVRNAVKEIFIEEKLLRQHCAAMSYGYTDFKRQMDKLVSERRSVGKLYGIRFDQRKNMTAGTDAPEMRVSTLHYTTPVGELDEAELALGEP